MSYNDANEELPAFEEINGSLVYRIWTSRFGRSRLLGRAGVYLTFNLSAFVKLVVLLRKDDVVVAKTDPPLISVVALLAAKIKLARIVN